MTTATRGRASRTQIAITIVVIAALVYGLLWVLVLRRSSHYIVNVVFPAATNLNTGGHVNIQGFTVGNVKHLGVKDGQAVVELSIDKKDAPLHAGTTAAIDYKSLLGERYVELTPGPVSNAAIPDHGVITGGQDRVEISQIVSSLGPATRAALVKEIPGFQSILSGSGTDEAQETIKEAGPTIKALAEVLDAVGQNGLALRTLVSSLDALSTRLVNRQASVVSTVSGLDQAATAVAGQHTALSQALQELPSTLSRATTVLGKLPSTTTDVLPLLQDLRPTTAALPAFAKDAEPVLTEDKPISGNLRTTLSGLDSLLGYTPDLLDTANDTVPSITTAATEVEPDLAFGRPYTPELAGFLTNWGNWLDTYNAAGHFADVYSLGGPDSLDIGDLASAGNLINTGQTPDPEPGQLVNQPWTDAAGNPIQ